MSYEFSAKTSVYGYGDDKDYSNSILRKSFSDYFSEGSLGGFHGEYSSEKKKCC